MNSFGWKNIAVRNVDGRTGRITEEWPGFMHVGIKIQIDGGGTELVQLNVDGPDSGATGWQWWCENFSGGPRWLWLGDHNETLNAAKAEIKRVKNQTNSLNDEEKSSKICS